MTEKIDDTDHYYEALDSLHCDATLEGRVTLSMHYAEPGDFWSPEPYAEAGLQVWIAPRAQALLDAGKPSFAVGVDTTGRLLWSEDVHERFGRPLILILSEFASLQYLAYLRSREISYVTVGREELRPTPGMPKGFMSMQGPAIDLKGALQLLEEHFAIHRLAVVGGGHLNGSMLDLGLIDEVSMMYGYGIDGRAGMAAAFDGRPSDREPVRLSLQSIDRLDDIVWLRYKVCK